VYTLKLSAASALSVSLGAPARSYKLCEEAVPPYTSIVGWANTDQVISYLNSKFRREEVRGARRGGGTRCQARATNGCVLEATL
jgi:hypothetical protein